MTPALDGVAWEDLAVLLAGLEHRSLNRAAQALRIGQSTASRRLVRLEERLGVHLFDRTPEGLLPTDFTLRLEPLARLIEGHMADIARLASDQEMTPRGRVRLAMPDGIASGWLFPILHSFYAEYPQVSIDVVVGHAPLDLVRREADIAVRFVRPTQPDLVVHRLGHIHLVPFVHPDLAHIPVPSQRWLVFDDPPAQFPETQWVQAHAPDARTMRISLWNALFSAVQNGLGAALLSPIIAEPAGLVRIGEDLPESPGREALLVYHRALRDVPRIRAFRQWLSAQGLAFFGGSPQAATPPEPESRGRRA